jgi:uncharacterized protein involved in exopolysaccharide biosynthesis
MQLAHKKRSSLLHHKASLERSLRDVATGRATAHLPEEELNQMLAGLRKRLDAVCAALAGVGGEPAA